MVSIHSNRGKLTLATANRPHSEKNSETSDKATVAAKISGTTSHFTRRRARISRWALWIMSPSATARTIVTNADR